MFRTIDIITSGLVSQRQRLNTIAENVANINTTRDAEGNTAPFQRRFVAFSAEKSDGKAAGVEYQVEKDTTSDPRRVYEPNHPDADGEGYVSYPNINLVTEFVNALEASRAYEANVVSFNTTQKIGDMALRILA
ncbi:flagellar basal body rod protein FlgC [Rubinisphaera italica]|uniref:Flagellar basal-body rod protein FlgC n=1 Tax=Rubinisphaera italica TaxID=2527969 RepID=A0A5C5XH73_9PLAN|nr:flagellar basal body rod protein FlgC [Rubinisphaera italica]TWT62049.1 Flagellar basal-body rod protein FlgC [Rubinisphaera italica]HBN74810.1 flagellar basal body rod protein FlgC [Planctomycetaceae bacterium]|tara:strand:+ start:2047 stop:2448 length:402 start_codon:yes stop_codon:yes gene_type:complete